MPQVLRAFDVETFLSKAGMGRTVLPFRKGACVYGQGDACDNIFYMREGTLKLTVVSKLGKQATIALLSAKDFVGKSACRRPNRFVPRRRRR